jgi:hypothetical protein
MGQDSLCVPHPGQRTLDDTTQRQCKSFPLGRRVLTIRADTIRMQTIACGQVTIVAAVSLSVGPDRCLSLFSLDDLAFLTLSLCMCVEKKLPLPGSPLRIRQRTLDFPLPGVENSEAV